jgi:hypothetical protein
MYTGARAAIRNAKNKMKEYKPVSKQTETNGLLQRKNDKSNSQDDSFYEDLILRIRKTNQNA